MLMKQQELTNPTFDSEKFLKIRGIAFRYFMAERMNFGVTHTVIEIKEYLSYYIEPDEMPTIATLSRWHSAWKRSQ